MSGGKDIQPSHLLQRVEAALWVYILLTEGFYILAADDRILELLQPRPHQTGKDQRIPLCAQPLPRSLFGVQLCLHITTNVTAAC